MPTQYKAVNSKRPAYEKSVAFAVFLIWKRITIFMLWDKFVIAFVTNIC